MNDDVTQLAVFDDGGGPALYAGGPFTTADGVGASSIAKWNGSSWVALGDGLSQCLAMTGFDDGSGPALYVGTLDSVSKWDGSSWSTLLAG